MNPFKLNDFTDPNVHAAYAKALDAIKPGTATYQDDFKFARIADQLREQALDRSPLVEAACRYLVLGQSGALVGRSDPERFFHYAANAFRDAGILQRAAESYFNSALLGLERQKANQSANATFSIRSAGRAKTLFAEVGDDEMSDLSHVIQNRLKQVAYRGQNEYLPATIYRIWDLLSEFGTSSNRWARWLVATVVSFAIAYAILLRTKSATTTVDVTGFGELLAPIYLSIGNLFQFGTIGTLTPQSPAAQVICILHGMAAFVLLGTGATFLTRR